MIYKFNENDFRTPALRCSLIKYMQINIIILYLKCFCKLYKNFEITKTTFDFVVVYCHIIWHILHIIFALENDCVFCDCILYKF